MDKLFDGRSREGGGSSWQESGLKSYLTSLFGRVDNGDRICRLCLQEGIVRRMHLGERNRESPLRFHPVVERDLCSI